jgi:ubiquinone/menaquinone biosynthesis C-methylase UbiE
MMPPKKPQADIMLEVRLRQVETAADSQNAYDALYSDGGISQPASFYLWMYQILNLQPDDIYLDISCGRGELLRLAQAAGIDAHGLDISLAAMTYGRQKFGLRKQVVGNGELLPFADEQYTVVSNIGSLEHYLDMKTAVQEMRRVLHPQGRAIILLPNTFSLLTNIWIAFRQGRTSIDNQPIQRYAARQEWQQLLEENGLIVTQIRKYERVWPRNWADLQTYLYRPKELMRLLLSPLIPLNLAWSFVFTCRKA